MILVSGGAGFIGSHLCDRLIAKGYPIICLDNFNDFYDPSIKEDNILQAQKYAKFTLVRGDILDEELLEQLFSKHRIEKIVHLAALAGVRPSIISPTRYVDVDVKGTVCLLEAARKYNIKQFIFGSSSSVYGFNEKVPFSEDDHTDLQVSPYATAKKAGELYCKTYHHLYEIPITILRFFTVYGPRQRPDMAIHKFVKLMVEKKPIPMFGSGLSERDYTYIDDCIDGIIAAIEKPFGFKVFNLGNSTTVKLVDLIELIAEKLGVIQQIECLPEQPGDVPITWADISEACSLLDYSPRISLDDGIERFVQWYFKNRN